MPRNSPSTAAFFEAQFRDQVGRGDFALNPFESDALEHLRGRVLDYGCGLGNLAIAAAARGCSVTALDASAAATERIAKEAAERGIAIRVERADLRGYRLQEDFDAIACIGLLMFFDCRTAFAQMEALMGHVSPGGVLVLNVLVKGTTYLDMFEPSCHCLFDAGDVLARFAGWRIVSSRRQDFEAPRGLVKSFLTVVAQKPAGVIPRAEP
jgi:tellurite methyltransferase